MKYSRIRLYYSRDISSSHLYWPFSTGTEFLNDKTLWICHPALRLYRPLRGARGNICALRPEQIALLRHFPWHPQPHLFANISDCVSFVQDGSNEKNKFDMERKSCDPGQAQALETWHKSTQCSRATQHHRIWFFSQYSWHLEDELGPTGFIFQSLWSGPGVDDITGFYCISFLDYHMVSSLHRLEAAPFKRFEGASAIFG